MANKLGQQLKLEQGTYLSPVQLLTSKLVELTALELEQRIERELEDNPALEEGREESASGDGEELDTSELDKQEQDWELGEYASEDDIPSYKLQELQERQHFREEIPFASSAPTLDQLLMEQLSMEGLNDEEEQLARYIVGSLNDEGYLTRSALELQDDLLFKESIDAELESIEGIIARIKQLDPAGVGARDLQECLLLQFERRAHKSPTEELGYKIVRDYYEDFMAKRFDKLIEALNISKTELSEVYQEIARLDPRPGLSISGSYDERMQHYNPDFIVWEDYGGELSMSLINEQEIRPLRLSTAYQEMLEASSSSGNQRKQREAEEFVKHKVEQARWFIEALQQRQDTLRRTMLAILEWQKAFFLSGDIADLRPMILKDIAELTGLDISTISRVSNSKSVQTSHGIYPIKYFFGEGMITEQGEEVSTKAIKQELQKLIDAEDKQAPLTDEELAERLSALGYPLARRTISKYREALHIPIARLRRSI